MKAINELVVTLPKFQMKNPNGSLKFRKINKRVQGKDLPKDYKKKNDWQPMAWYTCVYDEPVLINHKVNLVDAFKKDGYTGLSHYVNALTNFLETLPAKEKTKVSFWDKIKKFFSRGKV